MVEQIRPAGPSAPPLWQVLRRSLEDIRDREIHGDDAEVDATIRKAWKKVNACLGQKCDIMDLEDDGTLPADIATLKAYIQEHRLEKEDPEAEHTD